MFSDEKHNQIQRAEAMKELQSLIRELAESDMGKNQAEFFAARIGFQVYLAAKYDGLTYGEMTEAIQTAFKD